MRCATALGILSKVLLYLSLAFYLAYRVHALPLSTSGRWVVDSASGQRVKLHCVNWAAHMPAVLAEGLDRQPLDGIAAGIAGLGFNCVRLTWATHLFTKESYENLTVSESLSSLGLGDAFDGVRRNNGWMVGITVREAFDAVVKAIGEAGLMVVLDNHVSRPQWCCGDDDGNGFFGDTYFDPEEWLRGLEFVATRYRSDNPQVVGMSMRNELRGPNQSEPAWYRNIARGAQKIHGTNPDVLIIASGLSYDTDLSFLRKRPLGSDFDSKLVLEAHWYAFSGGQRLVWADQPPNRVCSEMVRRFDEQAGFVIRNENGTSLPLFVSEFGVDQRGTNRADNRFLSCFLGYAAERDLDWALWALQGSYYLRNGIPGFNETYGVLDANWDRPKNPRFREKFRLIQDTLQDPRLSVAAYQIIYHPHSGQCVSVDDSSNVVLSDCKKRKRWSYNGNRTAVWLMGSAQCLRVEGEGLPVLLSAECDDNRSVWGPVSSSWFQISGMDAQGRHLCLERNSSNSNSIFTKKCLCLDNLGCSKNPQTQWFHFIPSNVE
ncbi:glycosyl hydrolase 5 family protein-like [Phoenix dactylifera]|uniref:Glycosyl hydrolase 5 family protein-like n=1 Tax=Phoenix dactylifera TaxID=42345 RepID=A0A8B7MX63_PHODC|nr:glycosyl hydrolase 5 family protein-like [Phoenix dactylifera]